ncbi:MULTISPECIES: ABC transporter permease [Fibrobacter]|uniref:Spermidine/putrescine transport system permease protein n=2 Tax=Fibrobacter TaxID=832 RepID=A0A1M6YCD3_9BACT|nr:MULTISPECIES: ABC transporter permease [Fibrobacter]MDD7298136.1 ABC transporter permease [Fibrobacter intestinalis]PBC72738.1 ABC-type spermidine/putrescine transport system permease subunit I [Fibrobacter sp. NR9]SHL15941.1 spermidine/putrescine transport system permease protein [Fibrobacter intestinalis]SJZ83812.1 spermidine/putrescine transport system permease protein [Fibrobacter intestinalis]
MQQTEVFEGKLTTRRRMRKFGALLTGPGILWLLVFLLLPTIFLMVLAFAERGSYGSINWEFSFTNLKRLFGFSSFGWSPDNLLILWRSLKIAVFTTVLCLVIGLPMAFWVANRGKSMRAFWFTLIMVPSCTNLVIRTSAWMILLGPEMFPAGIARFLGLLADSESLYPGSFAVYIGMVSAMLPFSVLPLYTSVERLDWGIVEAARDLYASPLRTFRHGILSQMMPGIVASVILTLVPSLGMYVISDLLGGGKYMLIGNLIQQQFGSASDWPFGAMLGVVLILTSVISLIIFQRIGGKNFV